MYCLSWTRERFFSVIILAAFSLHPFKEVCGYTSRNWFTRRNKSACCPWNRDWWGGWHLASHLFLWWCKDHFHKRNKSQVAQKNPPSLLDFHRDLNHLHRWCFYPRHYSSLLRWNIITVVKCKCSLLDNILILIHEFKYCS